ncbi:MAG TPA: Stp1/IreP family PP2C-type Ser/Thr phosphatase [Firmicutes bacterium]|nr:Stp1/IreP family PP2C-type Ser/Thr phosphatase [Candidatus Fermentithermobacillaceae bacterium]
MEWRAETSRGLVRPKNEDSWSVVSLPVGGRHLWLAMVADGIGGHDGGEVASALAVDSIKQYISEYFSSGNPGQVLKQAILYGNGKIRESAIGDKGIPGMGTTLTCVMISCDMSRAFIGHVGDSRAYIVSNGKIRRVTDDHSVSGELVRNGTISEEDAMRHPGRNVLTMALGTQEIVDVDIYEEKLNPDDILVVCTDGLTSLVSPDEIYHMLLTYGRDLVARKLVDLANARGGYDNVTVIVLWPQAAPGLDALRG